MPSSLVHENHGVSVGGDHDRDFRQMKVHGVGIAEGQDEAGGLPFLGTYGAKDIDGLRALVARCGRTGSALCPASGDLVLLSDARFVCEPNFYRFIAREGRSDLLQLGGKAPF